MPRYAPTTDKAIALLRKFFFNRTDVLCVLWEKNFFPSIGDFKEYTYLDEILYSHLTGAEGTALPRYELFKAKNAQDIKYINGTFRAGSYSFDLDSKTIWAVLELDGGSHHAYPLQDPKQVAAQLVEKASKLNLKVYVETSGSNCGYHLWFFFEKPLEAYKARALLFTLLAGETFLLQNGEAADAFKGHGIEVFPKSNKRVDHDNAVGTLLWLPWYHAAVPGGCIFLDRNFAAYTPEDFETNAEDLIDLIIEGFQFDDELSHEKIAGEAGIWHEWRQKVLKVIDLDAIYGDLLTGKKNGSSWLECRDPWSETGDRAPSAGVADGTGPQERGTFHSFVSGDTYSVFDFLRKANIVEDTHIAACRYISNLTGVPLPLIAAASGGSSNTGSNGNGNGAGGNNAAAGGGGSGFANIITNNRQFRDILQDVWNALNASNSRSPYIFLRGGEIVKIGFQEDVSFKYEKAVIKNLREPEFYGILGQEMNWIKTTNNGFQAVMPLEKIARDMLISDHPSRKRLPRLRLICNTPIFSHLRELVDKPGYDARACIWYHPYDSLDKMDPVNRTPLMKEVEDAKQLLLDDVFVNFPFTTSSDIAHLFSATITPFIRQMIDGPVPMHIVEAPREGTGKSKLVNAITTIIIGKEMSMTTLPGTDEEIRKKITAILQQGNMLVLFDNVSQKKKVDSADLASALTSVEWEDRILGESRLVTLPNYALWMMTANNPETSMEIARRCVTIRLDAKSDQPWIRKGFKHPFLETWIKENRARIIHGILTIVQYWISQGCPLKDEPRLGSFEHWSAIMGGILDLLNIPGFLGNLQKLYEVADQNSAIWRSFTVKWYKTHGDKVCTTSELLKMYTEEELIDMFGEARNRSARVADMIKNLRDRTVGNLVIKVAHDENGLLNSFYLLEASTQEETKSPTAILSGDKEGVGEKNEKNEKNEKKTPQAFSPYNESMADPAKVVASLDNKTDDLFDD